MLFFRLQHFYSVTSKLVLRHGGLSGAYLREKGVGCGRSTWRMLLLHRFSKQQGRRNMTSFNYSSRHHSTHCSLIRLFFWLTCSLVIIALATYVETLKQFDFLGKYTHTHLVYKIQFCKLWGQSFPSGSQSDIYFSILRTNLRIFAVKEVAEPRLHQCLKSLKRWTKKWHMTHLVSWLNES